MAFSVGVDVITGIGRVIGIERQASLYLQNSFAVLVDDGVDKRPENRHKDHRQQEIRNVYRNIVRWYSREQAKVALNRRLTR